MTSKIKKPEFPIIAGCLQGLTAFLVNFTQSADEGMCTAELTSSIDLTSPDLLLFVGLISNQPRHIVSSAVPFLVGLTQVRLGPQGQDILPFCLVSNCSQLQYFVNGFWSVLSKDKVLHKRERSQ